MKVLFIYPPWTESTYVNLPLGVAYMAAVLLEEDHIVKVIDAPAEKIGVEEIKKRVKKFSPDFVAISAVTPMIKSAMECAIAVKKVSDAKIIFGGVHPSLVPSEILALKQVDFVVRGEGEMTMKELVEGKLISSINGLSYKKGKKITHNRERVLLEDLDKLPFPARDLFPLERYRQHLGEYKSFITMMTSRGCPFKCAYCINSTNAMFGKRYRAMSAERVVEEIKYILDIYQPKEIDFYDDNFTFNQKRVEKICDLIIKNKLKFKWKCSSRSEFVSEGLLKKMKKAGCYIIAYGAESGDEKILNRINRTQTLESVRKAFKLTKKAGIKTLAYFMIGLPGETKKTLEKTLQFAIELDPDYAQFAIITPFPGTKLYDIYKKKGHIVGKDWSKYIYTGDYATPVIMTDDLKPEQLKKELRRVISGFYLRPKYIFKKFLELYSLNNIIRNINGFLSILRWVK